MSDFSNGKYVVTRKPHLCILCNRLIPVGSKAYHESGIWEGDWQSWYMCKPCEINEVYEPGEEISDEDFWLWVKDLKESLCPVCDSKDTDWDWNKDETSIVFNCNECDATWEKFIGFGEKNDEVEE